MNTIQLNGEGSSTVIEEGGGCYTVSGSGNGGRGCHAVSLFSVCLDEHADSVASGSARGDHCVATLLLLQSAGSVRRESHSGGSEGVSDRQRAAPSVDLLHVQTAELARATHESLAEVVRVEGVEVGEHLAGECLVDLEDVDVGQFEARLLDDLGNDVGGRQQQLVLRVLGHVLVSSEVGLGLESVSERVLLSHEECGGGAVGEERGVGGSDGSVGFDEGGLEGRQLLEGRDADSVIGLDSNGLLSIHKYGHDIAHLASSRRRLGQRVRADRELVLFTSAHSKCGGESVARVSHRFTRSEFGHGRQFRREQVLHDLTSNLQLGHGRLRLLDAEHRLARLQIVSDGHVRQQLRAAGNHRVRVPSRQHAHGLGHGDVGRDAGERHRVAGNFIGESGEQGGLARNVGRLALLDHGTADDVIDELVVDARLADETFNRLLLQINRHHVLEERARGDERRAHLVDEDNVGALLVAAGSRRR
ncbi:hypothetical protein PFISCL1PPCAC_8639 [Pristionchus fissidentatus]|uniref:Uncharacterized protein n=1 Tax=Pristionchus fissidentatus TaxID=1538716 RepID=A0AAV5VF35_9BILA|nr:hypothetical protein PFISCL1PPCAC_8639 [Pristionchus fissidentatus]